jgi:SAM-dependent methyltransferase
VTPAASAQDRPPLPDPRDLLPDAPRLRDALDAAGWSAAALDERLGVTARTHLDRDELAPLLRRTAGGDPLDTLARLFVAGVGVELEDAERAAVPETWLRPHGYLVTSPVRLQPVVHGGVEVLVPHDAGRAATGVHREQVLGVGAASLTLAAATPRTPVRRTLDLGAGCGIQALLAEDSSDAVVATDRNPRATGFTRLAAALNGIEIQARTGDLLEPVAGERFDLVVSNPPFVVGAGGREGVRYVYRDAGLEADEVCRRLVQELPAVLAPGGTAVLLANWLHVQGQDGDERVRSWFRGTGCDGWVVQRELAAPEDYVTAWLRDTDEGARFDELFEQWVGWFDERRVEAVAFGVVALRAGGRERVALEDVGHPVAPTWGEQVPARFAAMDLLEGSLLQARLQLREDVRLHQVGRAGADGWTVESSVLQQGSGLRWSGGVDAYGAALLAGCDGTRRLGELVSVLAAGAGLTDAEAAEQVLPVVERLVEQGFLVG